VYYNVAMSTFSRGTYQIKKPCKTTVTTFIKEFLDNREKRKHLNSSSKGTSWLNKIKLDVGHW
jgi:hypothetical protein